MNLEFKSGSSLAGALPGGAAALPRVTAGRRIRGTETILLVEHQRSIREQMARCLTGLGYQVLLSSDAEAALAILRGSRRPIDLLLTDFSMPGMSGTQLARLASVEHPEIRVLYTSSHPEELVWEAEFRKQKPAWLAKPFTLQILATGVRKALGSRTRAILVVDEDNEVRAFLADALRTRGYTVLEAASLSAAKEILNGSPIDLMIGDLAGFERGDDSVRKLRRRYPATAILVMTGSLPALSRDVRRRSRRPIEADDLKARWLRGANATLPKPVSAELLLETVSEIFER